MNIFLKIITTEPVKTFVNEENEQGSNLYYGGYVSYDYSKKILLRKPLHEVKKN